MLKGTDLGASSGVNGLVEINNIPNGVHEIVFSFISYQTKTSSFVFPLSNADTIEVGLSPSETNLDEIIITSTRSSRSIDDIPMRIESITSGELEEKAVMQPANIKMLLTESTGIQTQQTSATSASASIRIQGLDGKYTQMLKDGFPLYSGFASGLSILQIPPLDLKRVEVIKGSSSTLYGGGAIAGLINLITKVPTDKREISLLVNTNQTNALDLNAYYSQKFKKSGVTFFASRNSQAAYDSNHDNFSDIPEFTRYTINPRIFYYAKSSTISLGANTSFENRTGGDMNVIAGNGDATHTYFQNNKSNRYSTQFKWEKRFENKSILTTKNSIGYFSRQIGLSDYNFSGNQLSSYSEISYLIPGDRSEWVSGLNLWTDQFTQTDNTLLPLDYQLTTAGAFVQNNFKATEKMILETGLRLDYNNQHKAFALPRLSLLYKFTNKLTSRLGGGLGYKAPTLFSEEAETRSFRNIQPLDLTSVKTEKSAGGNFDVNYKTAITDELDISINQLFFYTVVNDPLVLSSTPLANGNYYFYNANGQLTSKGFETNLKISVDDLSLYVGYTYIDAKREFDNTSLFNPLTAKHRINTNVMYEIENKLRVAYELFYIGQQYLSTGELTRDYWVMGISVQRNFNKISLFINAENFLDSRQSRWEPLYTGSIQNPQFREIYSPTDGLIFNGGFKLSF
jgi:iron complex outermembrane receptor protein